MKKNEIQQLKNLAPAELKRLLEEHREALRNLRFDLAAGKLKNIGEIHKVKKIIARILTFLRIHS